MFLFSSKRRSGNILFLTMLLMIGMIGVVAFAVDIGYMMVIDSELQRTADAAAMSAAWDLIDEEVMLGTEPPEFAIARARETATLYSGLNRVGGDSPLLAEQDTLIGYLANRNAELDFSDPSLYNAVTVHVRRTSDQNGEVPLFFSRALGIDSHSARAQATAAFAGNIIGVQPPGSGEGVRMLPFALDVETWDSMKLGEGEDEWTWDPDLKEIVPGPDGVLEVNLFPQGTGSSGNRGTIDIGSNNNSAKDISRQITEGVSAEDLEYFGGSLEFDVEGEIRLNGDTGISAGVRGELESIMGEPNIILLFREVVGPGNNSEFVLIRFVGVRIMEVKLSGSMHRKRVMVQPATVVEPGGIPGPGTEPPTSEMIVSPVLLIR